MKDEKIYLDVKELLQKYKKTHLISDVEIEQLSTLLSAVVNSSQDVRIMFYEDVFKTADKIYNILKNKEKAITKKIKKDNGGILN